MSTEKSASDLQDAVMPWMAMTIAADGALFRIRELAEGWRDGCNSYLRDAGLELIAICDSRDASAVRLHEKAQAERAKKKGKK